MNHAAAVIVTYNSEEVIGECLDSCLAAAGIDEIVVVDNASTDGTCTEVRRRKGVTLLINPENQGFAAAVNRGVRATQAGYILLLNPDAVLLCGIPEMIDACRTAAAAGGKLICADGAPQTGFAVRRLPTPMALAFEVLGINRIWPSNPVNRRYRRLDCNLDTPCDVEQPAGAFLMFRRSAWEAVGGFDEEFFPLWFEDVDFCKRLHDRGLPIRYVPQAIARHQGGHSIRKLQWESRALYWYANLLKYAGMHFSPAGKTLVCFATAVGVTLRTPLALVSGPRFRVFVVVGRLWRLAWRLLWSQRLDGPRRDSAVSGEES